ncbi:winged helix-turn-helix domain-containing protein [Aquimarina aquimarini]|uniref:winged helix-turn-helix domain-containing protein n=1 Tax=Aquimarina aquimarini TaxID=1191734 RepID=UPI001F383EAC|nr:winged helix-turn-helix domain-containing protein [Aquimarina aquimarini]
MAKKRIFAVSESKDYLNSLRKKSTSHRIKTRLLFLLVKYEPRFKVLDDLSKYLDVSKSSLRHWPKLYDESGLESLLTISNGGKRIEAVPVAIHKGLEEKLRDSSDPLLGYHHAIDWVKSTYGIDLKYNTLRMYMKRHFGTKLKIPRKSHYKKDLKAIKVFKKPAN